MNEKLILVYFNIANGDTTAVVVNTPAVLLDTINAVCIGADIVDVHYHHRVIGIDIDIVNIV